VVVVVVVELLPLQELLQNHYGLKWWHRELATKKNYMLDFLKGVIGDGGSDGGILGTFLSCWPKILKSSLLTGSCHCGAAGRGKVEGVWKWAGNEKKI